jgi:hypothetical protein
VSLRLTAGGGAQDRHPISDAVWGQVDQLRGDLGRVRAGPTAPEYAARTDQALVEAFDDPVAASILMQLVESDLKIAKPLANVFAAADGR